MLLLGSLCLHLEGAGGTSSTKSVAMFTRLPGCVVGARVVAGRTGATNIKRVDTAHHALAALMDVKWTSYVDALTNAHLGNTD